MLLAIRCWLAQVLMPKELRIYFQLFLIEKIKEMEQELQDIAYGKIESEDEDGQCKKVRHMRKPI